MKFVATFLAGIALAAASTAGADSGPVRELLDRLGLVEAKVAEHDQRLVDHDWRISDLGEADFAILQTLGQEMDAEHAGRIRDDIRLARCGALPDRLERACYRRLLREARLLERN